MGQCRGTVFCGHLLSRQIRVCHVAARVAVGCPVSHVPWDTGQRIGASPVERRG
jgi:hypothetical protein